MSGEPSDSSKGIELDEMEKQDIDREEVERCTSKPNNDTGPFKNDCKKSNSSEHVKLLALALSMSVAVVALSTCVIVSYVDIHSMKSEIASLQEFSYSNQNATSSNISAANTKLESEIASLREFSNQNQNATLLKLESEIISIQRSSSEMLTSSHNTLNTSVQVISQGLEIKIEQLSNTTQQLIDILIGEYSSSPAPSCASKLQLSPSSTSDYYWVKSSSGSAVRVYCDMTRTCGNITGGWMRVAELDMTDNNDQCPSSLVLNSSPRRTCLRTTTSLCSSDKFSVNAVTYSNICGRVRAYQVGLTDAFTNFDINTNYVDGVSLTHGNPRQHIWTFAAAHDENNDRPLSKCLCINTALSGSVAPPPDFVGNDYFCDTGASVAPPLGTFLTDDPLWDGAGCGPENTCCSFNNPPWFYKQLPQPTTDDIEMRVCHDQNRDDEDIAVEAVDLYVR